MTLTAHELRRLALLLYLRGLALVLLSAAAIRWPEEALLFALITAGGIAGTLGIIELATAIVSRSLASTRGFLFGSAALSITFGVLTVSVPVASLSAAITLATIWLLLSAAFALLLAARMWYYGRERHELLAWSAFSIACALLAMFVHVPNVDVLMYFGTAYVAVFGALQVAAALWIHHERYLPARRGRKPRRAPLNC